MAVCLRVWIALAPFATLGAACGSGGTSTAPPPPVALVTIVPESVELVVGGVEQLTAATWDDSGRRIQGRAVTWASSNRAVAAVSDAGLVTALSPGSTTITVVCEGRLATAVVSVFLPMGV